MSNHKKILLFALSMCVSAFASDIGMSYKSALQKSAKDGKPILLEFYAKWCIPCLEMEKTVFRNPAVVRELRLSFHFVRINTEKAQTILCEGQSLPIYDCMTLWEVDGIPAFGVVDKDGNLQHLATGEYGTEEFLNFLKAIKVNLGK